MSDTATPAHPNAARRSGPRRLPIWAPPLLFIVAAIIGIFAALPVGNIGLPYLIAFSVAAVVATMFVDPRGLVITVAQQPLLFTLLTPITAWLIASWSDPSVGGALDSTPTKTRLITAAYPIIQYFPWMAMITLLSAGIALWRYLEITRINAKTAKETRRDKARLKKAEQKTVGSATTARRRVAESDARLRQSRRAETERRPASEIIQAAEERRRRAAERSRAAQAARRAQQAEADERRAAELDRARAAAERRRTTQRRRLDPRAEQRLMEQRAAAARRSAERPAPERGRTAPGARDDRRTGAHGSRGAQPTRRPASGREVFRGDGTGRAAPAAGAAGRTVGRQRFDGGAGSTRPYDDVRREPGRRERTHGDPRDGQRREAPRRRNIQEWPPRQERPRHSPRDDRRRR